MAFEKLVIKSGVEGIPNDTISVSKTAIAFGDDFFPMLTSHGYLEIYLDRENNQVGFKPVPRGNSTFKVREDKVKRDEGSKRTYLSSTKLNKLIALGRYKGIVNQDGLIVINVPEIANPNKE